MWIAKNTEWDDSHTDLTKYFIERIKQRVDPTEVISNKHRTTNGYTMIIEIITVAELVKKRPKFIRRLKSLFDEAKCKKLNNSVVNDLIIKNYFPDIQKYFTETNFEITISDKSLTNFILKQRVFADRLANYYFGGIFLFTLGEELGWRGFLQDQLNHLPKWKQYLIIGTMWEFWHFTTRTLSGSITARILRPILFIAPNTILSFLFGESVNKSKSIIVAVTFHAWYNLLFEFSNKTTYIIFSISVLYWILMLLTWDNKIELKN